MINVVFHRFDSRDRLHTRQQTFASLEELRRFLASPQSNQWEWAELAQAGRDGQHRVVALQANSLRSTIMASSLLPAPN